MIASVLDVALSIVLVFTALVVAGMLVYAEYDRSQRSHRFSITLRRSHLSTRRGRGQWRWYLHPTFTPDAFRTIVGADRSALAGWARTPIGAMWAAHRSRTRLEADLVADRRAFLHDLTHQVIVEDDTHAIFPPEIHEGHA